MKLRKVVGHNNYCIVHEVKLEESEPKLFVPDQAREKPEFVIVYQTQADRYPDINPQGAAKFWFLVHAHLVEKVEIMGKEICFIPEAAKIAELFITETTSEE